MIVIITKRLLWFVPVLLGVTMVSFILLHVIPGDPVLNFIGERGSPESIAHLRKAWGLDQPLARQYGLFLAKLVRLDLGESFQTQQKVGVMLAYRLRNTLVLTLWSLVIASILGISLGLMASVFPGILRKVVLAMSVVSLCVPVYLWALFILWLFAIRLQWFPVGGSGSIRHVVLPAIALSIRLSAYISRMTFQEVSAALKSDYVRTAISKGLSRYRVLTKHALRNALIPVVTVIGLDFASLLNGSVLTETIFAWPGMGKTAVNALLQRDLPVVQGIVLISAVLYLIVNMVMDVVYVVIDPRIRYG